MPHPDLDPAIHGVEQRATHAIVKQAVVEDAFPRAGDPRHDGVATVLFDGGSLGAAGHRERQGVQLTLSVPIVHLHEAEKCRMSAAPQRRPVDESCRGDRAGLAAEPPLPLDERHERLLFDDAAHAAVERGVPDHAGKQGRHGRMLVDDGDGPRRRGDDDLLQLEPVEAVGRQRQEVRLVADLRQLGLAEHLDGRQPRERLERNLDRLNGARQVGDAEDGVALVPPDVGQHLAVARADELEGAAAENRVPAAERKHALHPVEQGEGRSLLRLDVDRLVPVDRVHDHRSVEARRIGARKAGVAVAAPLHRRADAVPIAEIDVVAHPDFVAVIQDRRAWHREDEAVHQLDARPAVLRQRGETAADADVQAHLRIRGVLRVHVVAFLVRHHLQRQLVVIAQEQRPLAVLRNLRRLVHDFDDGMALLLPQAHEDARHQREMERHVALVAVAKVGADVGGPLIGLRQEHLVRVARVELAAEALEHLVRLGQVLVDGPFTLDQVRDRVQPERIHAHVEPETHDVEDRVEHGRIVEVQIRLMGKEAVPVVLPRHRVECPVRLLSVHEDDPRAAVFRVGVAPDVVIPFGRALGRAARPLKPGMLVGRVIDDQLREHTDVERVRRVEEAPEVVEGPVHRVDRRVVGDVIAVVPQRRRVEGQEPEAGDAEVVEVGQLLREAGKITDAVAVAVEKGADVRPRR